MPVRSSLTGPPRPPISPGLSPAKAVAMDQPNTSWVNRIFWSATSPLHAGRTQVIPLLKRRSGGMRVHKPTAVVFRV